MVQTGQLSNEFNIATRIRTSALPSQSTKNKTKLSIHLDETSCRRLTQLLAEAERAIELLQERRTALISAAVTGKIDVRGLEVRKTA